MPTLGPKSLETIYALPNCTSINQPHKYSPTLINISTPSPPQLLLLQFLLPSLHLHLHISIYTYIFTPASFSTTSIISSGKHMLPTINQSLKSGLFINYTTTFHNISNSEKIHFTHTHTHIYIYKSNFIYNLHNINILHKSNSILHMFIFSPPMQ